MKIQIVSMPHDTIATNIDLTGIKDKGEISHAIAELERIKLILLKRWENML